MERSLSIPGIILRSAVSEDLPGVVSLLREAGLITAGVADHVPRFVVAVGGGRIVGAAGLEIYGDTALLRSVAVAQPWRGRGLGASLVREALARARKLGVREVALLTTSAAPFFHRLGFREVARRSLDPRLAASEELGDECCTTAAAMTLRLWGDGPHARTAAERGGRG